MGVTTFRNIRPDHRPLEIDSTWNRPPVAQNVIIELEDDLDGGPSFCHACAKTCRPAEADTRTSTPNPLPRPQPLQYTSRPGQGRRTGDTSLPSDCRCIHRLEGN